MKLFILLISFVTLITSNVSSAVILDPGQVSTQAPNQSLTSKEKKQKISEIKKRMKAIEKRDSEEDRMILLVILAVILPPLSVFIHQDEINTKFWVSLILTFCFWIPGVIYSLLVVLDAI